MNELNLEHLDSFCDAWLRKADNIDIEPLDGVFDRFLLCGLYITDSMKKRLGLCFVMNTQFILALFLEEGVGFCSSSR